MKPEHLYVHVPFCRRRCSYCDFAVDAVREVPVSAWLDAVATEFEMVARSRALPAPLDLATVYIGGGTPSLLGAGAMAALRRRFHPFARWDGDRIEWTAEANPESLTAELAADWRTAGVNRLSLGVQTFDERVLRWMGRLHGAESARDALRVARAAGLENVSVDLIFGLPERFGRDWRADLDRVLALAPPHVSLYGLTAEPGTPLGRWVASGRERMPEPETYVDEYQLAVERLTAAGYRHYEVSNFALPGFESRHNMAYWRGVPYIGLGPGAHSYWPPERRSNVRDWATYRDIVLAGGDPVAEREEVTGDAAELERIWLGLRADAGLPAHTLTPGQRRLATSWVERGWAELTEGAVRLNANGWLLLDRLAVELDEAREGPLDATPARATHSTNESHPNVDAV